MKDLSFFILVGHKSDQTNTQFCGHLDKLFIIFSLESGISPCRTLGAGATVPVLEYILANEKKKYTINLKLDNSYVFALTFATNVLEQLSRKFPIALIFKMLCVHSIKTDQCLSSGKHPAFTDWLRIYA